MYSYPMLAAEIRRKLGRALHCSTCLATADTSSYLGFEDIVTSNVFGALRYMDPKHGLEPVLRDLGLDPIAAGTVTFWPRDIRCEPDVVVDLQHSIVVIEAKVGATFGADQLPREVLFAHEQAGKRPWRLLCVTGDRREPRHSMFCKDRQPDQRRKAPLGEAVASFFAHVNEIGLAPEEIGRRIFWLSWSELASRIAISTCSPQIPPHVRALVQDLLASLEIRGLLAPTFDGFAKIPALDAAWPGKSIWTAQAAARRQLTWTVPLMSGIWRARWFRPSASFNGFCVHAPKSPMRYDGWFTERE